MSFAKWLSGFRTHRKKALALYRAGMAKADKKNYAGAITDYSEAAQSPDIPLDVKGMVFYNRALAYSAINEDEKAAKDLAAMLEMPGLPENVKTAAHQRRERLRMREARKKVADN